METLGPQLTPETAAKSAQREHGGDRGSGNTPSAIPIFGFVPDWILS